MQLSQIKKQIDELKTNKAVLESKKQDVLKQMKTKYGISSVEEAKDAKPKLEKQLRKLEGERDELMAEAENLLDDFEEEELDDEL